MDLNDIRRRNLLFLYSEFVAEATRSDPTSVSAKSDESFAKSIQLAKSAFSSMKSGGRGIGDKIARQIEALQGLPRGWMDEEHASVEPSSEDVQLSKYLKMATRLFNRADDAKKRELFANLRKALDS